MMYIDVYITCGAKCPGRQSKNVQSIRYIICPMSMLYEFDMKFGCETGAQVEMASATHAGASAVT
jgi:hypothetical protein